MAYERDGSVATDDGRSATSLRRIAQRQAMAPGCWREGPDFAVAGRKDNVDALSGLFERWPQAGLVKQHVALDGTSRPTHKAADSQLGRVVATGPGSG